MKRYYSIYCLLIFSLIGCSKNIPTDNDIRKPLEQKINSESEGFIKLLSVEKTNAVEREIGGVKLYQAELTYTIEFTNTCYKGGDVVRGYFEDFRVMKKKPSGWNAYMMGSPKTYEKGKQLKLRGKMIFEKAEKGWRVTEFTTGDGIIN